MSDYDKGYYAGNDAAEKRCAAKLAGRWQPIETVPVALDFIIAAWPCAGAESGFDVGEVIRDGSLWLNLVGVCVPTHWQPLPAPPVPTGAPSIASDGGSVVEGAETEKDLR